MNDPLGLDHALARDGAPLVTFAPILKLGLFPLDQVLEDMMELGVEGMGSTVEIETDDGSHWHMPISALLHEPFSIDPVRKVQSA